MFFLLHASFCVAMGDFLHGTVFGCMAPFFGWERGGRLCAPLIFNFLA
jgi:hypothetical protein